MAKTPASVLAWIHLLRIHHKVQRRETAHLAEYNLTLPQFDALAQLRIEQGITQQTLADRLLVTKGNVCGLMDRLVEQGLVERCPDPEDRRAHKINLTSKGQALIDDVLPAQRSLLMSQFAQLDSAKQKQLLDLLSELDRSLSEE